MTSILCAKNTHAKDTLRSRDPHTAHEELHCVNSTTIILHFSSAITVFSLIWTAVDRGRQTISALRGFWTAGECEFALRGKWVSHKSEIKILAHTHSFCPQPAHKPTPRKYMMVQFKHLCTVRLITLAFLCSSFAYETHSSLLL